MGIPDRNHISRRRALGLLGLSAGMALIAACQPGVPSAVATPPPAGGSKPASTSAPAAEEPRSGGILRQGNLGDLPTLDGNFLNGQSTIYPVWDRLVELDPQLNARGILVESWDVDDKYTRIALHLRKGVRGTPVAS